MPSWIFGARSDHICLKKTGGASYDAVLYFSSCTQPQDMTGKLWGAKLHHLPPPQQHRTKPQAVIVIFSFVLCCWEGREKPAWRLKYRIRFLLWWLGGFDSATVFVSSFWPESVCVVRLNKHWIITLETTDGCLLSLWMSDKLKVNRYILELIEIIVNNHHKKVYLLSSVRRQNSVCLIFSSLLSVQRMETLW